MKYEQPIKCEICKTEDACNWISISLGHQYMCNKCAKKHIKKMDMELKRKAKAGILYASGSWAKNDKA